MLVMLNHLVVLVWKGTRTIWKQGSYQSLPHSTCTTAWILVRSDLPLPSVTNHYHRFESFWSTAFTTRRLRPDTQTHTWNTHVLSTAQSEHSGTAYIKVSMVCTGNGYPYTVDTVGPYERLAVASSGVVRPVAWLPVPFGPSV